MATVTEVPIRELVGRAKSWNPVSQAGQGTFPYIDLSSIDRNTKTISESAEIAYADAPSRARQLVSFKDILVSTVRPNLRIGESITGVFKGSRHSSISG